MSENLYTTAQAAKILKVNSDTIRRWLRTGKLKGTKLPSGSHRIPQSELDRFTQTA